MAALRPDPVEEDAGHRHDRVTGVHPGRLKGKDIGVCQLVAGLPDGHGDHARTSASIICTARMYSSANQSLAKCR
jgi:hypothetical protein